MADASWGGMMKARARALGLSDAAVARALGMAQRRYSAYVNETREPDFGTFIRICRVLRTTPDQMLGFTPQDDAQPGDGAAARAAAALAAMAGHDLERAASVLEALAQHSAGHHAEVCNIEGEEQGNDTVTTAPST